MYKTKVHIDQHQLIDYSSKYAFLGSCFSEHLSLKMIQSGFQIQTNPFGVVFNPMSLSKVFLASDKELKNSIFERNDVALSWLANSTCFAYDQEELYAKLISLRNDFLNELRKSKVLFVTFGTAWVYMKKSSGDIVGNCHKAAKNDFEKRLLSVDEITIQWKHVIEKLENENSIKVIFTVSPVRHTKDGLIENSRSKAILLNAVHQLKDNYKNVDYFPAYEVMIDEMRDYAYYKKDGIHPNDIAIDEIWNRFKVTFFTPETDEICKEYDKINMLFEHQSIHPESTAAKQFNLKRQNKWEALKKKYPFLIRKKS
ncbi:hypothetical protein CW751_10845 [Brumimicrobium salinarum]|uniref:GSCFA domain-containing protein n=1 Tax=Brumimicrobium salinarum TaxID=2058658 RepID=A0A2I0R177_9FLAO|nr:GSCFA domain-containing protein [Brumimicrobium salinarum]PKR80341.1 hypothetical protein CW751_10845 [Brumimicrobium salinarum]